VPYPHLSAKAALPSREEYYVAVQLKKYKTYLTSYLKVTAKQFINFPGGKCLLKTG
jgi:hypothetical protein